MLKTALVGGVFFGCVHILTFLYPQNGQVFLADKKLNESSGICVAEDGATIWSHNDSGDEPRLFAFTPAGDLVGRFKVKGAKASDWEDMCSFCSKDKHYFAIGDIGDNNAKRKSLEIYVVKQPKKKQLKKKELDVACRFKVDFPDGPVNCEGLAYDARNQTLVLFTKELLRCRLFSIDASDLSTDRAITASLDATIMIPVVTGADISVDGEKLALVTYGPGAVIRRKEDKWDSSEEGLTLIDLPPRRQGESVCFDLSGENLLLTSEHTPTPLYSIPVEPE